MTTVAKFVVEEGGFLPVWLDQTMRVINFLGIVIIAGSAVVIVTTGVRHFKAASELLNITKHYAAASASDVKETKKVVTDAAEQAKHDATQQSRRTGPRNGSGDGNPNPQGGCP